MSRSGATAFQTCHNSYYSDLILFYFLFSRLKLQVFKTEKRGWGIRTLCDIPAGSFICVYVGNLYTNEEGNKQGVEAGDEYFAGR